MSIVRSILLSLAASMWAVMPPGGQAGNRQARQ